MDWIDGANLRQAIKESKTPFSPQRVLNILKPVCTALNYTHKNDVLHCDIKPANIMLNKDGRVLLTDFGVARLATEGRGGGTPAYMAPEQIQGQDLDIKTDIYALGVTLYEVLSGGILPYRGESPESQTQGSSPRSRVEWEHCNLPLPPLQYYNPRIPQDIAGIVVRAMHKRPQQRYPDALALVNDFERACSALPPEPASPLATMPEMPESLVTTMQAVRSIAGQIGQSLAGRAQEFSQSVKNKAEIAASPKGPHLLGLSGGWLGRTIVIPVQGLTIGRNEQNLLCLQDASISRLHATIGRTRRSTIFVRDENSRAGTFVNGARLQPFQQYPLEHGYVVSIGTFWAFEFRMR